jgi:hypothetical protein
METWRAEDVVLWPHTSKLKTDLIVTFNTGHDEDSFNVTIEGDHLPEGTDGHKEYFVGSFDLNKAEAKALYDELGQWLK